MAEISGATSSDDVGQLIALFALFVVCVLGLFWLVQRAERGDVL